MNDTTQHGGWLAFAGIMIPIAAVLNSLAVFFVDVLVIYGLAAYGGQRHASQETRSARAAV